MDPIATAIIAAISSGAMEGIAEAGKSALSEAYERLKALLIKKFGHESDIAQAVSHVEAKPESEARKAALLEEIAAAQAAQDPDLLQAAQAVLLVIPASSQFHQQATGSYIAQADRGSNASVNIGVPPSSPRS